MRGRIGRTTSLIGVAALAVATALAVSGCVAMRQAEDPGAAGPSSSVSPSASPRAQEHGDTATWQLLAPDEIEATTTTLAIAVTRLGCASGETGEVLAPRVTFEVGQIVIQVDVEPLGDGMYECPGNDAVMVEVELEDPVAGRALVDGACLEGEAATTAACADGPVRHPATG
ncbi:hypothetical protein [Microbacterium sulfonylureivorans]|uniref:hypothetical protein n=1 Tax=Microbacterium sulfonylureivorans TaxID=2486854 RepID=UPI000FDBD3BA|nr:hypothetical protein [Microbacterium sulfonylureivorans]